MPRSQLSAATATANQGAIRIKAAKAMDTHNAVAINNTTEYKERITTSP